ncbi:MAG: lytic transglycosylase domain-containing protein [Deltaproteobacteria bacterium]|nr:lytic transglycosylase domain-containing protein [Deltaproteobacteria bacterium]MBW2446597.1 lytic transglycosylase domain-containing protein [Deltaproteobacteria bacterium]
MSGRHTRVLLLMSLTLTSFHLAPADMPEATALERDPEQAVRSYFESRTTGLTEIEIEHLVPVIVREADRADLTPAMILAVIEVESGGRVRARSNKNALGLMQILPRTGRALAFEAGLAWNGPETLYDPVTNVRLGVRYLEQLVDRFGDVPTALAAYNAGPTRVAGLLRTGQPIPRGYAERVLTTWSPVIRAEI